MSLFPPITVSHPRLTSIDSPERGPGTVLSPSGSKRSSNVGAIAGGVVGGIAVVSVLVAAIFFFLRRRRSRASSAASADDVALNPHMGQVQRPVSDDGTVTASFPETTALMKPYVRVFGPPSPDCVCSLFVLTLRTRMTQLRFPGTKELQTRHTFLLKTRSTSLLKYRPTETYTPLPACRAPKQRDIAACPLSDHALWSHRSILARTALLFLSFISSFFIFAVVVTKVVLIYSFSL
jgi:hypothetical protein